MKNGSNFKIGCKGFTGDIHTKDTTGGISGVGGLLPAELYPMIVPWIHEWRILERLPAIATSAPSYEFIRHHSTTGAAAVTAEGATKPEVFLNLDSIVATPQKIACQSAVSWETFQDYDKFVSYLQIEIPRQVIDVENQQLL